MSFTYVMVTDNKEEDDLRRLKNYLGLRSEEEEVAEREERRSILTDPRAGGETVVERSEP